MASTKDDGSEDWDVDVPAEDFAAQASDAETDLRVIWLGELASFEDEDSHIADVEQIVFEPGEESPEKQRGARVGPGLDPPGPAPRNGAVQRLAWSPAKLAHLVVLPYSSCQNAYVFTAAPLHFLDKDWGMYGLGAVYLAAVVGVVCISNSAVRCLGGWALLPLTLLALAVTAVVGLWAEDNKWATLAVVYAAFVGTSLPALRSLLRVGLAGEDSRGAVPAAERVANATSLFGFASSALLGGIIYDFGGWYGCVILQMSALGCQALLLLLSPWVRASWRWRGRRGDEHLSESYLAGAEALQWDGVCMTLAALGGGAAFALQDLAAIRAGFPLPLPVAGAGLVALANTAAFGTGVATIAPYLVEEFQGSPWLCGVVQAGCLLLGGLAVVSLGWAASRGRAQRLQRCSRHPLAVSVCLLAALCCGLLAVPEFALVVAAVLVLGLAHACTLQLLLEALVWRACDPVQLRAFLCLLELCRSVGWGTALCVAVELHQDFRSVPYAAFAALCPVMLVAYGLCLCCRGERPQQP